MKNNDSIVLRDHNEFLRDPVFKWLKERWTGTEISKEAVIHPEACRIRSWLIPHACGVEKVIDGRDDTYWEIPGEASMVDLGLEWFQPRMMSRVKMVCGTSRQLHKEKEYNGLKQLIWIEIWDEKKWNKLSNIRITTVEKRLIIECGFSPRASSAVRIVLNNVQYLRRIYSFQVFEEISDDYRKMVLWGMRDELGEEAIQHGDPVPENLQSCVLGPTFRTFLGEEASSQKIGVLWNGGLLIHPSSDLPGPGWTIKDRKHLFVAWSLGNPPTLMGESRAVCQEVKKGGLPVIVTKGIQQNIDYSSEAFVHNGLVYLKIIIKNLLPGPQKIFCNLIYNMIVRWLPKEKPPVGGLDNEYEWIDWHQRHDEPFDQLKQDLYLGIGKLVGRGVPAEPSDVRTAHPEDSPYRSEVEIVSTKGLIQNGSSLLSKDGKILAAFSQKANTIDREKEHIIFPVELAARGKKGDAWSLDVIIVPPYLNEIKIHSYPVASARVEKHWDSRFNDKMNIAVPEEIVNKAAKIWIAQLLTAGHKDGDHYVMPYCVYPSFYANRVFGMEEGWMFQALAQYGFYDEAEKYLSGTLLSPEYLKSASVYLKKAFPIHHAWQVYQIVNDAKWAGKIAPTLYRVGRELMRDRRRTMKNGSGIHEGFLPASGYGGDLDMVGKKDYPFFLNIWCWRALRDLGFFMRKIGDDGKAAELLEDAVRYRQVILKALDYSFNDKVAVPFIPMGIYEKGSQPFGGPYYQIFSSLNLLSGIMGFQSPRSYRYTDYLAASRRIFMGLNRFSWGDLDSIYSIGNIMASFHRDDIERFLLGFYGMIAASMDRERYTFQETQHIFCNYERWDRARRQQLSNWTPTTGSDPLLAFTGVALMLLRTMLISEELDEEGIQTGTLLIAYAVPRAWLGHGNSVNINRACTALGKVSYKIQSKVNDKIISAEIEADRDVKCRMIKIRLRHPDRARIMKVRLNGENWNLFDPLKEIVLIPWTELRAGKIKITAKYA